MQNFVCKEVKFQSNLYKEAISLRDKILRQPLGLQFSQEELAQEVDSHHLVCLHDNEVIGVIVMMPIGNDTFKMRQVAIAKKWQRKGIGQKLVDFSETFTIGNKKTKIVLHARDAAIPFYLKLGYRKVGEAFEEVGIKHFKMEKRL